MSEKKLTFSERAGRMTAAALDLRYLCEALQEVLEKGEVFQQVLETVEKEAGAMKAAAERFAAKDFGAQATEQEIIASMARYPSPTCQGSGFGAPTHPQYLRVREIPTRKHPEENCNELACTRFG